jgi:hypothetical protein
MKDKLVDHWNMKNKNNLEVEMRKKKQKMEMIQKYLPAREKSLTNSTTLLNGDELKSLLQYHQRKGDSPIKLELLNHAFNGVNDNIVWWKILLHCC